MRLFVHVGYAGCQPKDSEVEQLLEEVEKYTLATHLFWGIWGIISVLYHPSFYSDFVIGLL